MRGTPNACLSWGTERGVALGRPWLGEELVDTALSPSFPLYPPLLCCSPLLGIIASSAGGSATKMDP